MALNACMRTHGGFEGNAQTFRILTRLEGPSVEPPVGLNLVRSTLLAIIKYPATYERVCNAGVYDHVPGSGPPKFNVYAADSGAYNWVLRPFSDEDRSRFESIDQPARGELRHGRTLERTVECSLINVADDIAYATHDLEDALGLGLVDTAEVVDRLTAHKDLCGDSYSLFDALPRHERASRVEYKRAMAFLIHDLITNVQLEKRPVFRSNRLQFNVVLPAKFQRLVRDLNDLVFDRVIQSHAVRTLEWRGRNLIARLFDAFADSPKQLLSTSDLERYLAADSEDSRLRVICDYIANMTDSYLMRLYARLFESRFASVFEQL